MHPVLKKAYKYSKEHGGKDWKQSHVRVVDSGTVVEVYEYEKPYKYDGNAKRSSYQKENLEKRSDALGRTQATIRRRIWANVDSETVPRFYTFTFKDSVDDLKEANKEWGLFRRRLKFLIPDVRYISIVEFQEKRKERYGKGAWHYHVLFFNMPDNIHKSELRAYKKRVSGIDKNSLGEIALLWGNGFVDVSPTRTNITAVRSIASYVSKYLSKGTFDLRLKGQKVFFCSRGLKLENVVHEVDFKKSDLKACLKLEDVVYSDKHRSKKHGVVDYKQYKIK